MKRRVLTAVLAVLMVFAYMPLLPYQQVHAAGAGSDIEQQLKEARAEVTAKESDLKKAEKALSAAQADLDAAGRNFLNEKAGSGANIDTLVKVFGADSELASYINSDTFKKALASGLSVENLLKAADFVTECNSLRAKHNLEPLKINYRMMCLAAVSAAISANEYGHVLINRMYSGAFNTTLSGVLPPYPAENLAWGYKDPFTGWYTAEKKEFEKYAADGAHPGLEEMSGYEISEKYPEVFSDAGHYLNIIDGSSTITGFSRNSGADEQCFGADDYGESVTPAAFKTALNAYKAGPQTAVNNAAQKVTDAKDALTQAKAGLKKAEEACAKAGHKYGAWKVTKKASANAKGTKERVCAYCQHKDSAVIPKISNVKLSKTAFVYSKTARKPVVIVKAGTKTLVNGTDYTVTYKNNKNVGKATVTIKGKGDYACTKTLTFKINPKGTTVSRVTAAKKGFTVKWKKQGTKMSSSAITGYEIQYSTSSTFKSGNKTVTVKGVSKVSKKITGLKGGKKYYVRVRTYKTVSGVKYYSKWSAKKAVTTKK